MNLTEGSAVSHLAVLTKNQEESAESASLQLRALAINQEEAAESASSQLAVLAMNMLAQFGLSGLCGVRVRCSVLGVRRYCSVNACLGSWYQVSGAWHLLPGTQNRVAGTSYQTFGTR